MLLTWQDPARTSGSASCPARWPPDATSPLPTAEAPGPFALSDPEHVKHVITAAGFTGIELHADTEPMWFGHDPDDAQRFVRGLLGWMLPGLDDSGQAAHPRV